MPIDPEQEQKVRALGLTDAPYEPVGARTIPLLILAGVILFAIGYGIVAWPTSPEAVISDRVPPVGLVNTTTGTTQPTTPPPATTTTTGPQRPPEPAWPDIPLVAPTDLGMLTIRETILAESSAEFAVTNPVWTGTEYTFVATSEDTMSLWASPDGVDWERSTYPASSLGLSPFPNRLFATSRGLLATGWVDDGPAAWLIGDDVTRLAIPRPGPGPSAPWLRWHHDEIRALRSPDGGTLVLSSVWGASIDWDSVLDLTGESWWESTGDGRVEVMQDGAVQRTLQLTAQTEGSVVSVTVSDVATGEIIISDILDLADRDAESIAEQMLTNGGTFRSPSAETWSLDTDGLLPSDAVTSLPDMWLTAVASGDKGTVAVGEIVTSIGAAGRAFFSSDGTTWEPITDALGLEERGYVSAVEYRAGRFVAVGGVIEVVQLTEQTSARTRRTAVWASQDGREWTRTGSADFDLQLGQHSIVIGELGWALAGQQCEAECSPQLWLSRTGQTWSSVDLRAAGRFIDPRGVAVGDDSLIMLLVKWDEASDFAHGELAIWTATIG